MAALAERLRISRVNKGLLVLLVLSALIGVMGGSATISTTEGIFRLLVLSNLLLAGYILLVRNLTHGILLYLYSLVFFNYYWRIVLPGLWPDIDMPRMLFIFIWMVFLLELLTARHKLLPNGALGIAMVAMLGAIILSMFMTGKIMIHQLLTGYVIPYAMFIIGKNTFTSRRNLEKFILWLAVPLSFYFPVTAVLEHYKIHSLIFPRYIGTAMIGEVKVNWGGRAMGAFIQPVATGFAIIAIYVLSMYSLSKLKGLLPRIYAALISILTPVAVFFTYTRSVYVGYVSALVVLLLFSRRSRITALIMIVALALAVVGNWSNVTSEKREAGGVATWETAQTRVVLMQASLGIFVDHPFFGLGFTRFVEKAKPYIGRVRTTFLGYRESWLGDYTNQHNQFFSVLTELGLVGFVPLVLIYLLIFRGLGKARRTDNDVYDSEFVVAVWAVMAVYLSEIFFVEPRFFEFMNMLPFLLCGIVMGGYQRAMIKRQNSHAETEGSIAHEGAIC